MKNIIVIAILFILSACVVNPNKVLSCQNKDGFFTCISFINVSDNAMDAELDKDDIIESVTIYKPDGKYVEKYKDGRLKCIYLYKKSGGKENECYADQIDTIVDKENPKKVTKIIYFESMKIKSKITMINGDEDVNEKVFYKTGELEFDRNYKNKVLNGNFKSYYRNGQLELMVNYIDGKKSGIEEGFYPTGQKAYSMNYKNGNLEGLLLEYSNTGQLVGKFKYKNNTIEGDSYKYFENGKIFVKSNYKEGKLDGKITFYHENGEVKCEFLYKEDKRINEKCDAKYPELEIKK